MPNLAPRELRRQRLALGYSCICGLLCWRLALFFLGLQRLDQLGQFLQVSVGVILEQAPLLGVEALGFGGELQPLDHRHLVGEFVDQRLFEA